MVSKHLPYLTPEENARELFPEVDTKPKTNLICGLNPPNGLLPRQSMESELENNGKRSEENLYSHSDMEPILQTPSTKKVRFSQPLEFWKEFDAETGCLLDQEGISNLNPNYDYSRKSTTSTTDKDLNNQLNSKNELLENEPAEICRGKFKARTISDVVQSFQIDEERNSVRKFIAHYKRSSVRESSQHYNSAKELLVNENHSYEGTNDIFSDEENSNCMMCTLCDSNSSLLFPVSKTNQAFGDVNTESGKYCYKALNALKRPRKRHKLPGICNGRKIYDERLLPRIQPKNSKLPEMTSPRSKSEFKRQISLSKLQTTPHIVQLFE